MFLDPKMHLTGRVAYGLGRCGRGRFPELPIHTLDQKRGLHLVVLYVVIDNQRFPWAFTVWQGKDTTSPAQLALRMLKRLPAQFKTLFQPRVLADGGFGSDDFLESCVAFGLPAVTGIRCDRRVERIGIERHVPTQDTCLNTLQVRGTRVELRGCSVPVWASWFKLKGKRKDGSFEATMPVSDPARQVRFGIKKVRFMVKSGGMWSVR